ncbi:MAG: hypothetical protein QOJ15_10673 [Bradyrhizobium sp.]|jgi:hypothetical protein|nr:hypothetical protein [Bradyrhizobium sp.]
MNNKIDIVHERWLEQTSSIGMARRIAQHRWPSWSPRK